MKYFVDVEGSSQSGSIGHIWKRFCSYFLSKIKGKKEKVKFPRIRIRIKIIIK